MDMDRRGFLKGVGTMGALGALGTIGLTGCAPTSPAEGGASAKSDDAVHPWEVQPDPITEFVAEETYDVVIVGAGIAGVSAAYGAAKEGARVAVVEKFGEPTAHGYDIGIIGSKLQAAEGIEIDRDLAAQLMYRWGQNQPNMHLIRYYLNHSGEIMDQVIDMAEKNGYEVYIHGELTAAPDWDNLDDRYKKFRTAHVFRLPEGSDKEQQPWGMAYVVSMLAEEAQAAGAEMKFNSPAVQLVREGDRVSAVIIEDSEGYKKINAQNGVILATGGISENEAMLSCWCSFATRTTTSIFPKGSNVGDGLVMGMQIGAARSWCPPAPIIHGGLMFPEVGIAFGLSWLMVNRDGMRFCDETNWEPILTNAILNAPGTTAWYVFDSRYPEFTAKQKPHPAEAAFVAKIEDFVNQGIEEGTIVKADTLEALAAAIDVPADTLAKTVTRYNAMCAAGVDTDFGTPDRFLAPVEEGPFYAMAPYYGNACTPYGLRCDQHSRVLDTEDNPIEGLFVIGNVQGDVFANTYPVSVPGASHGRALTYGWLVGEALAHGEMIDAYSVIDE